MNAGQRAVAVAKVRLLSSQSTREAAANASISQARVFQADIVLRFAPELADQVLAGELPLNDAYAEARGRSREGAIT